MRGRPVSRFLYDLPLQSHTYDRFEISCTTGGTTGDAIREDLPATALRSIRVRSSCRNRSGIIREMRSLECRCGSFISLSIAVVVSHCSVCFFLNPRSPTNHIDGYHFAVKRKDNFLIYRRKSMHPGSIW